MADRQAGEGRVGQHLLEPGDPFHVQVVGRLVQQQQVGAADQLAGDGQPLHPAARERGHLLAAVGQSDLALHDRRLRLAIVLIDVAGNGRSQRLLDGLLAVQGILLGDVRQAQPSPGGQLPGVGGFQPGHDSQQRGLARAVRPDQPGPLPLEEPQGDALEQHAQAVRLGEFPATEKDVHPCSAIRPDVTHGQPARSAPTSPLYAQSPSEPLTAEPAPGGRQLPQVTT